MVVNFPSVLEFIFLGTLKKEKSAPEMPPFQVRISPQLSSQIIDCLNELQVTPTAVKPEKSDQPISLLSHHVLDEFHPAKPTEAGVVPWSPPQPNWNCWTSCNIDEG